MTSTNALTTPSLYQVALCSTNMERMIWFYRDVLGQEFVREFKGPPNLVFFNCGGVRMMLEEGAASTTLYYRVESLELIQRALNEHGYEFVSKPIPIYTDEDGTFGTKGETEWMAFTRDPSENLVGFVERRS